MPNQHAESLVVFRAEIERVKAHLEGGGAASEIANALHAQGLWSLQILFVFREATGASIGDLKALGQWWGVDGVTDTVAFDRYAAEILNCDDPP